MSVQDCYFFICNSLQGEKFCHNHQLIHLQSILQHCNHTIQPFHITNQVKYKSTQPTLHPLSIYPPPCGILLTAGAEVRQPDLQSESIMKAQLSQSLSTTDLYARIVQLQRLKLLIVRRIDNIAYYGGDQSKGSRSLFIQSITLQERNTPRNLLLSRHWLLLTSRGSTADKVWVATRDVWQNSFSFTFCILFVQAFLFSFCFTCQFNRILCSLTCSLSGLGILSSVFF